MARAHGCAGAVKRRRVVESLGEHVAWPVRSGQVPSLADDLSLRPNLAADLGAAMVAGAVLVLVPVRTAGEDQGSWLEPAGKTQLAACLAEMLWQLRKVELPPPEARISPVAGNGRFRGLRSV